MEVIRQIWEFLSGKKTVIGTVCLWIAGIGLPFIINEMNFHPGWFDTAITILNWLGGILAPLGIGHKAKKKYILSPR